jgi:hypothetical protein
VARAEAHSEPASKCSSSQCWTRHTTISRLVGTLLFIAGKIRNNGWIPAAPVTQEMLQKFNCLKRSNRTKPDSKTFAFYSIRARHGQVILRLLPYYPELNAIENIWAREREKKKNCLRQIFVNDNGGTGASMQARESSSEDIHREWAYDGQYSRESFQKHLVRIRTQICHLISILTKTGRMETNMV